MKLKNYKLVFIAAGLVGILIFSSPTIGIFVRPPSGEQFSEFWLLDSKHMAEKFPSTIQVGEENSLFLGVGNHLGNSTYYLVYVKFSNKTQPLPNSTSSEPSSLSNIHEFQFILLDGDVWEIPITFEILDASVYGNSMIVDRVSINDRSFQVDCTSTWDSENSGFYFQLFFELWIYNSEKTTFEFHDRFVGVWLNIIG